MVIASTIFSGIGIDDVGNVLVGIKERLALFLLAIVVKIPTPPIKSAGMDSNILDVLRILQSVLGIHHRPRLGEMLDRGDDFNIDLILKANIVMVIVRELLDVLNHVIVHFHFLLFVCLNYLLKPATMASKMSQ